MNVVIFIFKKNMISKLSKNFHIIEKKQSLEIYQNVIIFSKKLIVNKN